jgi:hypothetical protein
MAYCEQPKVVFRGTRIMMYAKSTHPLATIDVSSSSPMQTHKKESTPSMSYICLFSLLTTSSSRLSVLAFVTAGTEPISHTGRWA